MQVDTMIPRPINQNPGMPARDMILVQEEPRNASQLVEIQVIANGVSRVAFPDVQQLRSQGDQLIVIKKIRLITALLLTNAPTSGFTNAPLTELQKIAITLYSDGWERGQLIPILVLNDTFAEGSGIPYRQFPTAFSNWKNVDWSKSYLQYANGTTSAGANYAVVLDVEYMKYVNRDGNLYLAPGQ
jgi:hypothetical protein